MADTKISALTGASALAGTEVLPGVQSAATVKITADQIGDRVQSRFALAAQHPGYVANNWYIPWPYTGVLGTSGAPGNGTIHFIPFIPSQTMTISTLGIRIVTAGTTNVQLAIYASQTAAAGKRPTGNALSSTASIVNTGAASSINAALGANVQVTAGTTYFLALNCNDGTMTSVSMAASTAMPGIVLGSATQATSLGASATVTHLTFAQAFGTWPDMTSNSCTESTASSYALIQFKVASIP